MQRKYPLFPPAICWFFLLSLLLASRMIANEIDPVLQFYWNKSRDFYTASSLHISGVNYRVKARSYYHKIDKRGKITRTDSLIANYFFSSGILDSVTAIAGINNNNSREQIIPPDVFNTDYYPSSFPNDTGGTEYAFSLELDSVDSHRPSALLTIDRYSYQPLVLFTHFADTSGYKRMSRSFRFAKLNDYLYVDSVWEVGSLEGMFSAEHYRRETGIVSITVLP